MEVIRSISRELGARRLELVASATTREEREQACEPSRAYPFSWGACWTHCIEYVVDDFAAEVGFWIDIVGLVPNALGEDYAMFTSPAHDFFFAVIPSGERAATPRDAIRMQFMLSSIVKTAERLERRGIGFDRPLAPWQPETPLLSGSFRTPNGIGVDLWGMIELDEEPTTPREMALEATE